MGHHGSKIDFSGIILGGFDPKITIPMQIRVRNLTFEQFLKIFKKMENDEKKHVFSKPPENRSEPVKKSKYRFFDILCTLGLGVRFY